MDNTENILHTPKTSLIQPYRPGKQQSGLKKVVLILPKVQLSYGDKIINKLKPFRFAMVTGLQRKGISTNGMKFKGIVVYYYNDYSGKKVDVSEFINNVAFKVFEGSDVSGDTNSVRVQTAFVELSLIVDSVVNLFKESAQKYDTAISYGYMPDNILNDEDISRAKAVKIVEQSLLKKFEADHFMKAGEFNTTLKWLLGFAIVLYLLSQW